MQVKSASEYAIARTQQKLSRILEKVAICNVCESKLPLGPNPIVQVHAQAKILIASQAPGSVAHALGVPFKDKSGERLRRWMGISEADFFNPRHVAILPMGFCYPGRGKSGDLPPTKECASIWRGDLLALLPNIQLTLLIGAYSQAWHLQKARQSTLSETVKVWQNYWPEQLPMPHPSPRNNIWVTKNPWFEDQVIPVLQQRIKLLLDKN
ncbi:uracil-DNA glycosylase family protein [Glaciecola punicea]|uniref:uracil-DNA glycosylase family protein n=1 Tax=Glaciecola punicea TaxID=56804 RepID=UPI0009F1E2DA|nr:uracil-DNA glycosylase family protein [Glaciecola punicea]